MIGGSIGIGVAYLCLIQYEKLKKSQDLMFVVKEPWPAYGSQEEKEALLDAILDEPCMLESIRDPTIKFKQTPYL